MKIVKDKTDNTIQIHFDGEEGLYARVSHGRAEWGDYGSLYMSLSTDLALKVAKQIIKKCEK